MKAMPLSILGEHPFCSSGNQKFPAVQMTRKAMEARIASHLFDDIKFCTGLSTESKVEIKFKFLIPTFVKEKQTRLEDSGSSREDMSPVEAIGQDDVRPRCQYLRAMACPPAAYRDDSLRLRAVTQ